MMMKFMDIPTSALSSSGENESFAYENTPEHKIVVYYPEYFLNLTTDTPVLPVSRKPLLDTDGFLVGVVC